jgi:hypothetical protein
VAVEIEIVGTGHANGFIAAQQRGRLQTAHRHRWHNDLLRNVAGGLQMTGQPAAAAVFAAWCPQLHILHGIEMAARIAG